MKRINTSGRPAGRRGGNVVHRLDLRSSTRRRKHRPESERLRSELSEADVVPGENAVAPQSAVALERVGGEGDGGDSQARHQIQLLERRLQKMTRLLEQQGKEISSARQAEDQGVASVFREVQGVESDDAQAEHKKALMDSIFRQNMKLRESVTFGSSRAR